MRARCRAGLQRLLGSAMFLYNSGEGNGTVNRRAPAETASDPQDAPPADDDRMIYAKLFTRFTGVTFYVAEGEQRDSEYLFWGMLIAPQFKFLHVIQHVCKKYACCLHDQDGEPQPSSIAGGKGTVFSRHLAKAPML
jgi:hypothetical protein